MRTQLAAKYIRGRGIEIGGLHFPLEMPSGAKVTYVDMIPPDQAHPLVRDKVKIFDLVIDDAEFLTKFGYDSLDFIIANHVIEHCHDPIGTLKTWSRKLAPGGIVYAAVPEKTQTFDRNRAITPLEHVIGDHIYGTNNDRDREHYEEWHRIVEQKTGNEALALVEASFRSRANIHFHVWDNPAMRQFLGYIQQEKILDTIEFVENGAETIWILRKPQ